MCGDCEDIYVMSPDGSSPTRLTFGGADMAVGRAPYNNTGADWSHRQKLIAFSSNRGGFPEIFLMNADGSDQLVLASLGGSGAVFPSFSHSGNELCFNSQVRPRDIYIVNIDGTGLTNLTETNGRATTFAATGHRRATASRSEAPATATRRSTSWTRTERTSYG